MDLTNIIPGDLCPANTSITALNPAVASKCSKHKELCIQMGIDMRVIETVRGELRQNLLYAQGRKVESLPPEVLNSIKDFNSNLIDTWKLLPIIPGNIVTYRYGKNSNHYGGNAYDCIPFINNKPAWNNMEQILQIGKAGKQVGMLWGGDWHIPDYPHFESRNK